METKEALQVLFCENLGKDRVDENDTIFDLGGTSLMIYKICEQAKERYQLQIKPIDLMMYPSIRKMSEYLENTEDENLERQYTTVVRSKLRQRRGRRNEQ